MSRHLVSTTPTEQTCPRCHVAVLVALEEGLPATVDRDPIPATAEVAILLDGRRTYTRTRGGQLLIHRDAGRIRGGWLHGTIHAEHRCPEKGARSEQLAFDITGVK